ncbi:MFS transporter [Streptomyces sp. NPDC059443]|uniref:MFS transporter n=1 Tax=unclassified Streptomyces TaxID=2593676 RepID=UPI0036C2295E
MTTPSASDAPYAGSIGGTAAATGVGGGRLFPRFLGGFGLSLIGDQIWFVALGWAASRLGSPLQTSAVMACASVPRAVLLLVGGSVSDRHGPLRVALGSQVLRLSVMAGGAVALFLAGESALWLLITIAVLFGALDAAHMPAVASLPAHLLAKRDLAKGQGAVQTLERTASVVGAPVGGFVVAYGGLAAATAVNVVLFGGALLVLRTLARHIPAARTATEGSREEGTWASVRSGLAYVARDPVVGRILLVVTMLNLSIAAPVNVGIALLAADRGWEATGFSTIVMAFAGGAIAGALLQAARRSMPKAPAAAGLRWVAACALCTAALPAFDSLSVTAAVAGLLGFTTGPASALLFGLVQARTEAAYLGRVMALTTFSALGLTPVSFTAFGALTGLVGLSTAFITSSAAVLLTTAIAYTNRTVRTAALDAAPETESR